jgi:HEPN pEK499 p136
MKDGCMQNEIHDPRDTISGFAVRTLKNLHYVVNTPEKEKVHVITQLVNSMEGLFVFPYEFIDKLPDGAGTRQKFEDELSKLKRRGWPNWEKWQFRFSRSDDVDSLLWHLRNALAHRRIYFSSDKRALSEVDVEFWDAPGRNAPVNWHVSINGEDLYKFVVAFGQSISRTI